MQPGNHYGKGKDNKRYLCRNFSAEEEAQVAKRAGVVNEQYNYYALK